MTVRRWERLSPLTGAIAVAIVVIAVAAVGGNTPDIKDSGSKVLAFYAKHRSNQENASFLLAIAAGIMMFFVATLWYRLRSGSQTGRLAMASLVGGVVGAGGLLMDGALHLALSESGKYGDATVAHTLNIIDANSFLPLASGTAVMVLAASASAWRTGALPKWLSVVGIIAGVASFTPAGFPAFLVSLAWIVVTSVALTLRDGDHVVGLSSVDNERSAPAAVS